MNYRKSNHAVIVESKVFLEMAYTTYDSQASSGDELFQGLMMKCEDLDSTARGVISKFKAVASEATQRIRYRAIIKVIWRYIRDKLVSPDRRLLLMVLAFSTLTVGARKVSQNRDDVDKWRNEIAIWLGKHLAGDKQSKSTAKDQAHQLFLAAYLPYFD